MSEVCRNEVKETCLVESYNSSLRSTLARFRRKTKAVSRSLISVYNSVIIWMNKSKIMCRDTLRKCIGIYYGDYGIN